MQFSDIYKSNGQAFGMSCASQINKVLHKSVICSSSVSNAIYCGERIVSHETRFCLFQLLTMYASKLKMKSKLKLVSIFVLSYFFLFILLGLILKLNLKIS